MAEGALVFDQEQELSRALRSMVLARWGGVGFAVVQVAAYDHMPYPSGVEIRGYLLAAVLGVGNLGIWWGLCRRGQNFRALRGIAVGGLVLDVLVVAGVLWLFAFDTESTLFILLFVLPAEAATAFGLVGALSAWAASTLLYVGRELYAASAYDAELSLVSINFRMGVLLLVSVIVGLFARNLARRQIELRTAMDQREGEAEWRNAMIDMLAHDLRSPVATAISTTHLLEQRLPELPVADAVKLAANAVRQNRRVLRLADDLLDLVRARGANSNCAVSRLRSPTSCANSSTTSTRMTTC